MTESAQSRLAKHLAAQHGFTLNGVALLPPDGIAPRAASYSEWLSRGFNGPLEYMRRTRETRMRLQGRFPWARSVLALGAFYDAAPRGQPGHDLIAHVARYARGRDYHLVFQRRLKKLARALVDQGIAGRAHWLADTGPVLERAWGEAAGLGWTGKNTCLIHPRFGSFCLLAEILLDAALAPDTPAGNRCGTCRRCLDACPTHALVAPGILDANRCLATWNIERRGDAPEQLWAAQGGCAVGCDICQLACPFNAPRRLPVPDPELAAPRPWHAMTLAACIAMTPAAFNRAFAASALRRAGLKGLRLAAITVAGNTRAGECRAALEQCRTDTDYDIRRRAEWALQHDHSARRRTSASTSADNAAGL
ncbi:MAG: tRNA epoxyqueuosine(34) reductase QueG [Planctomycetota bacterium]|nr:tRNA epoxyqueuosine(34) reductase QueG [Planctomycetota bacterium]